MTTTSESRLGLPSTDHGYALGPDDGEALWFNGGLGLLRATAEQTAGRYAAYETACAQGQYRSSRLPHQRVNDRRVRSSSSRRPGSGCGDDEQGDPRPDRSANATGSFGFLTVLSNRGEGHPGASRTRTSPGRRPRRAAAQSGQHPVRRLLPREPADRVLTTVASPPARRPATARIDDGRRFREHGPPRGPDAMDPYAPGPATRKAERPGIPTDARVRHARGRLRAARESRTTHQPPPRPTARTHV